LSESSDVSGMSVVFSPSGVLTVSLRVFARLEYVRARPVTLPSAHERTSSLTTIFQPASELRWISS